MKIVSYIKESFEELVHRITWISLAKGQKVTVVVALFSIVFSLLVFMTDEFFRKVLSSFFNIF